MTGHVTSAGVFADVGGVAHPIPAAKTPVGAWIAAIVAQIDRGELLPCPHCGRYCGCDCDAWVEAMEGCHATGNAG